MEEVLRVEKLRWMVGDEEGEEEGLEGEEEGG